MNSAEYLADNPYARFGDLAIAAPADERLAFIRKTYAHLTAAIYGLVLIEFLYFKTLRLDQWVPSMFSTLGLAGVLFGGYMVISDLANAGHALARRSEMQYVGLFTYVFSFSVILCPLLWIANFYSTPIAGHQYSTILVAAIATLAIFGAITATVFLTKKDFSFLGPILGVASIALFGVILLAMFGLFNFSTGLCIVFAVFAGAVILYDTSNVLHQYRTEQYVAAALRAVRFGGLLFWYVLQILMSVSSRR